MSVLDHTRVRRLSPTLANQIAAGEVIERPASVIKELLENSVDAGATRLDIDVEQGGISLMKVRDDGCGIHGDDLVLALSRHATSKVASLGDLESVSSLGFRGEALPSVASVARVEICSRLASATNAWQLTVEGVEVSSRPQPAAHPGGTTVTVRDLFFNTPARRKFLRTEKTELRHIEDVVKRVALSRFDIEVRLRHNTRPVWMLPPASNEAGSLKRLSKLCGAGFCEHALRIEFEAGEMRLSGWLAMPGFGRRQTDLQFFFMNRRMVRDRIVTHAIRQAYEADLPPGTHPAFVLYLEMDPTRVDVNVHPAKHEVRFRDSRSVHDFLFRTLNRALSEHRDPSLQLDPTTTVVPGSGARPSGGWNVGEQMAVYGELGRQHGEHDTRSSQSTSRFGTPLSVVGEKYLITQGDQSLIVIDLAAARHHITWLRLRKAHTGGEVRSRPLLVPVNQVVSEAQATLVEEGSDKLAAVGLDIRRLGPESVSLRQIPIALEQAESGRLIAVGLEYLSGSDIGLEGLVARLASCAADSAVANDPTSIAGLLSALDSHEIEIPQRPICYRLGPHELAALLREAGG